MIGALGGVPVAAHWLGRSMMWEVSLLTVLMILFLLVIRQIKEQQFLKGNLVGVLLLLLTIAAPRVLGIFQRPYPYFAEPPEHSAAAQPSSKGIAEKIISRRRWFVSLYADQGSNIDTNVQINNSGELLRYVPRAVLIGCCAPFPEMWFSAGRQVGRLGRVLSGFETVLMYFIQALVLFYFWRTCGTHPAAWLLLIVAAAGMTALGLVVINIRALFRMR